MAPVRGDGPGRLVVRSLFPRRSLSLRWAPPLPWALSLALSPPLPWAARSPRSPPSPRSAAPRSAAQVDAEHTPDLGDRVTGEAPVRGRRGEGHGQPGMGGMPD